MLYQRRADPLPSKIASFGVSKAGDGRLKRTFKQVRNHPAIQGPIEANPYHGIVTGAIKDLGYTISRPLAAQGFTVLVAKRDLSRIKTASYSLNNAGAHTLPVSFDVSSAESIAGAVRPVSALNKLFCMDEPNADPAHTRSMEFSLDGTV
jgi:hypothetical protein